VAKDCPSGHFCVPGTVDPAPCPILALCPEGSAKPGSLLPLVFCLLVYIGIAVLRWRYLRVWRLRGQVPGQAQTSATSDDGALAESPSEPQAAVEGDGVDMDVISSPRGSKGRPTNEALANHFREVSEGQTPIQLDFRDLRVTLPAAPGEKHGRVLLEGVTGSLKPGTVTAILGPSGAGKTVLLTTLLQRIDPSWRVEGHLEVNKGRGKFSDLRSSIGFVPQDDVLHNELTVEANLFYASELRLPATWPAERKHAMREVVLEALGLLPHRTTPIGTEADRGVSGGQRKRASIGVELA
jgi:ABC-type multidrug transport system fused ATPase/permease subunit